MHECACITRCSVVSEPFATPWTSPLGSSVHGYSPGKNTGVGSMPSSRALSRSRNRTHISCIAGGFLTRWAIGRHSIWLLHHVFGVYPRWLSSKEPTCNAGAAGDAGSLPGWGRSPGRGHGNPLHYSCLENPTERGAQRATVHRVTKSETRLKWLSTQDTIDCKTYYFMLRHLPWHREQTIGKGNGNPLQCSCLENPRDGGAWWAAVYGVAQSQARLKQLSSSSREQVAKAKGSEGLGVWD